jgi:ribosomal protein L22
MSAEQDKDDVTTPDAAEAKKPARKKAAKKPVKAAKGAEAKATSKGAEAKAEDAKAEAKKPVAKKAAKKPAAKKEPAPVAKKERGKAAAKPRRRVVRAHARYVRTSACKARMVCGHLRGKSIDEARAILAFTPREVARDWSKLLESAVANAESNHELLEDDLIVREAYADEGPTIKRFRPRAMGRATPIRKRTSHLTIALTADAAQRTTKRNG